MNYLEKQSAVRDSGDTDNIIDELLVGTGVPNTRTDDWNSYFADIPAGGVQYGGASDFCAYLSDYKTAEDADLVRAIVGYSPDSSPADYDRSIIASTTIDVNSSGRPWTFQYCTEFGWYQTRSPYDYLRTPLVNEQYFAGLCSAAFSDLDWSNLPKAAES